MDNTNLFTSSSDGSFQFNTNFANERLTNLRVNQAQEGFDKEMEAREMAAVNTALQEAKPALPAPHNKDPKTMTQEERHAALQIIDQRMESAGIENRLRGDSDRNPILGEITDGLRNIGQAFGVGNRVSGESGFVDADGKFHPRTCFTKGTLVTKLKERYYEEARNGSLTPDAKQEEKVAIETIKAGDWVLSRDENSGILVYKKVTELFRHEVEYLFKMKLSSGEEIKTTWNHPFMRVNKVERYTPSLAVSLVGMREKESDQKNMECIEAKDLRKGDNLINRNGKRVTIASIESMSVQKTIVYNFEVADTHNYLVGDAGVVVHNYLPTPGDGPFQVAQKTGLTMAELEKLNPGLLEKGTFVGVDIKLEPSVTEESQTDTKYGAKAKETLQDVINRYNREQGTNYTLADIQGSNPFINNVDSKSLELLQLPIGTAVHFPERSSLDKLGNFFTLRADELRNFAGKFNRITGALGGYKSLVNSTEALWQDSKNNLGAKLGYGVLHAATTIIGAPIAYGLHVAGSTVAMAAGTLLQPMSPVDYTWGAIGTGIGLVAGTGAILAGKVPRVKNGVVQFDVAIGVGAGISFGPVNFGERLPKPKRPGYPFDHEYGHTIQNRTVGPAYLGIMAASGISALYEAYDRGRKGTKNYINYQHENLITETSATNFGTEEYYRRGNAAGK